MKTAKEYLIDGLIRLDNGDRWIKGELSRYIDSKRCWCAIGALVEGDGGDSEEYDQRCLANEALGRAAEELFPHRTPGGMVAAANFNDHADTTFDDVKKVYELAIKRAGEDQ